MLFLQSKRSFRDNIHEQLQLLSSMILNIELHCSDTSENSGQVIPYSPRIFTFVLFPLCFFIVDLNIGSSGRCNCKAGSFPRSSLEYA